MMSTEGSNQAEAMEILRSTALPMPRVEELRAAVKVVAGAVVDKQTAADEFWAVGALHPSPAVRIAIVLEAAQRTDDDEAVALLGWSVNDVDDSVAVAALNAIRTSNCAGAMDDVFIAAGRSTSACDGVTSGPVDTRRKAAVATLKSLIDRHADPVGQRRRLATISALRPPTSQNAGASIHGMVKIPGSGAFYIDRHPVTWREYNRFVEAVREDGPLWSHPGQSAAHDHDVLRNVPTAQREALMNHPVTYVSWFDAWAYATWAGKKLPSAAQWERAAGAREDLTFPWGDNAPTPAHARFWDGKRDGVDYAYTRGRLNDLTTEIGRHHSGASEHGVEGLIGNVWEWTRTRYLDGLEISPFVGSSSQSDAVGNWTLTACVKGGSWATPLPELKSEVRVPKNVMQRGPEVGFRCVFEPGDE